MNPNETINVAANGSAALSSNTTYYASYYKASAASLAYNVNGGSGSISSTAIPGYMDYKGSVSYNSVNVTTSKPTAASYRVFAAWNTNSGGTGTDYAPGATYSGSGGTLYARYRYMTGTISVDECSRANIRSSASSSSSLVGKLHNGDSVSVISSDGSWYYIYANIRSENDAACDGEDIFLGYKYAYVAVKLLVNIG